jgi:hypothetical protein
MTISLLLPSVAGAIANLTATGVTFKNYNGVVASWQSQPNVLYPNPEGFITGFVVTNLSFPRGASEQCDISYTLNYRFLGTQIGDLANLPAEYGAMIDKLMLVLAALITAHAPYSGAVDMTVGDISVGARSDPAGNLYHGADIALNITEMQNP